MKIWVLKTRTTDDGWSCRPYESLSELIMGLSEGLTCPKPFDLFTFSFSYANPTRKPLLRFTVKMAPELKPGPVAGE